MLLAKSHRRPPRQVAEAILAHLPGVDEIERAEVAGPGFLNVFLSPAYCRAGLARILAEGARFGTDDEGAGQRAMVEFVSANPTGPLTLGHGRQGILGDCVARLFGAMGYETTREYYFNNAGRQMRVLGESVRARYLELLGRPAALPEDGYQGDYIREIAADAARAARGVARGRGPRGGLPAGGRGRHLRRHPADPRAPRHPLRRLLQRGARSTPRARSRPRSRRSGRPGSSTRRTARSGSGSPPSAGRRTACW